MSEIHNKINTAHWTDNVTDWKKEFETGDVVLSWGNMEFQDMVMVYQIDLTNKHEYVQRKAAFWEEKEATNYAESLIDNE